MSCASILTWLCVIAILTPVLWHLWRPLLSLALWGALWGGALLGALLALQAWPVGWLFIALGFLAWLVRDVARDWQDCLAYWRR
jgi:hypothetical protein